VAAAKKRRLILNAYLEDWSQGVRGSPEYVFQMTRLLLELGVRRVYLADTLGVQSPDEAARTVDLMVSSFPDAHFEYHCHNDYGLANANCLAAVRAGALGVHTSVNGLGERAGNTRLAEVVAVLNDHSSFTTGVDEKRLAGISRLIETMSGKDIAANAPIVGADVFTQTAGIHADGDAKGDLYGTKLAPKRFGRERRYALGKLSGKASLDQNLARLGIELGAEARDRVLQRIVELGDKKHAVVPEDLRFILADVLKEPAYRQVSVEHYEVSVARTPGSTARRPARRPVRATPAPAPSERFRPPGLDRPWLALLATAVRQSLPRRRSSRLPRRPRALAEVPPRRHPSAVESRSHGPRRR
jgi:D-citramalate synthase